MVMPPRWGFDYPDFKTVNLDVQYDAFIFMIMPPRWGFDNPDFKIAKSYGKHDAII
jgi:hypothetical protein